MVKRVLFLLVAAIAVPLWAGSSCDGALLCQIEQLLNEDERANDQRQSFYLSADRSNGEMPLTEFDPKQPHRVCATALCRVEKKLWEENNNQSAFGSLQTADPFTALQQLSESRKALTQTMQGDTQADVFNDTGRLDGLLENCLASSQCTAALTASTSQFKQRYERQSAAIVSKIFSGPNAIDKKISAPIVAAVETTGYSSGLSVSNLSFSDPAVSEPTDSQAPTPDSDVDKGTDKAEQGAQKLSKADKKALKAEKKANKKAKKADKKAKKADKKAKKADKKAKKAKKKAKKADKKAKKKAKKAEKKAKKKAKKADKKAKKAKK